VTGRQGGAMFGRARYLEKHDRVGSIDRPDAYWWWSWLALSLMAIEIEPVPERGTADSVNVSAEDRAEQHSRLAVAKDVAAVPLVDVEVPAAGRDRRGHVGEHADRAHDHTVPVGDQVPQHVQDRALALAAAEVDVGGVRAGRDPCGVDDDGQYLAARAIGNGEPSPRRAVLRRGESIRCAGRGPVGRPPRRCGEPSW
jgi:hypothetical protein